MSPYLNVATPEPLVVVKNRPRRRGQLTPEPRITRGHDGLSTGGAKGTRTPDPHTASVVRYQLRHSPKNDAHRSYTTGNRRSKSLVTASADDLIDHLTGGLLHLGQMLGPLKDSA